MFIEGARDAAYGLLGVRPEYSQTSLWRAAILIKLSDFYARKNHLEMSGSLCPGAGLLIGNHVGSADFFRVPYAGIHHSVDKTGAPTVGRLVRTVSKSTLFGIPEPPEMRERTGKKDLLNSDNKLVQLGVKLTAGALLDGVGGIPVVRGEPDRRAMRTIDGALEDGQIVALSIMASREKTGVMRWLGNGAAFVAMKHPDVPIYISAISKSPNVVKIAEPFTYSQIRREQGDMKVTDFTLFLADRVVELTGSHVVAEDWAVERETQRQKLNPSPRHTASIA